MLRLYFVAILLRFVVSIILEGAKVWLLIKPVKRIRQWRTRRKMRSWHEEHGGIPDEIREEFNSVVDEEVSMNPFPQGTQTLSGIAVLILVPWLAKYGIDGAQAQAIVAAIGTLAGAVIAVLGYLRRKKLPAE